ncbi:ABC transporter ATP-binding protein [Lactovum miscens]|uniref:ATP-binding cassette subfamily B protein n=1 Tax=Lactovum miscens TaxID=190387 RepID=A0A841C909_9LACT|nr:ABC transporter ATP-binding protein [Lactovum miscens]MBB5888208.1 ATP-binding cassette subfamily B protein [Lactovum miscens]
MIIIGKKYLQPLPVFLAIFFLIVQVVTNLLLPNLTSDIINKGIAKSDLNYIWAQGGTMLIVALVSWLAAVLNVYYASIQSQRLGMRLRSDLFEKVIKMDESAFSDFGDATLITRTTNDVTQLQNVYQTALRMMLMSPLMLIGSIFMAWNLDHNLIWVFIVALPLLAIVAVVNIAMVMPRFRLMQEKIDKINLIFQQGLTGVRVIRAFNRDNYEIEKFDRANKDLTKISQFVMATVAMLGPIMTVILSATNLAIVWFGAQLIGKGLMGLGNLVAFLTYATQILLSFMQLTAVMVMVPRAQVSAVRANEILNTEEKIVDPENSESLSAPIEMKFIDVSYAFSNAERPALSRINFTVTKGQTLAIIGGTGSGKSTLLSLIARLMDVTSGEILIAGRDIRSLSQYNLHEKISLTQQKAVLFSGTVKSNMLYGRPEATDAMIWTALDIAQATDFVKEQGGLEMTVEQNGGNFSGGQRQRLAIARTLIKDADYYCFDDSFSALDFATDTKLRTAINSSPQFQDKIKIIVAQRIATVMNADQILVLDKGEVVGLGDHASLAKNCSAYQDIMRSQLSEKDLESMGISLKIEEVTEGDRS